MSKIACNLVPGDVVSSGEIVTNNIKSLYRGEIRAKVTLRNPKTGTMRVAAWGYYSTIFMKKST